MKKLLLLVALIMCSMAVFSQHENPNLDTALARSLGADEYGMKMYIMVILKTGSRKDADQATKDSLFAGHMLNIQRLVNLKKLIVAGPFEKNDKDFRGIFILDAASMDEANKLLETDPAIKGKLLEPVLFDWYGSAALPEYLKYEDKIWKIRH